MATDKLIFILLFAHFSPLSTTSIWIPEESPFGKQAKDCYVPLRIDKGPRLLSRSYFEIADVLIEELAKDSSYSRIASVLCLRKTMTTKEDRIALAKAYETSFEREDHLAYLEARMILSQDREYPLTPFEEKTASEWALRRKELVEGIREVTKEGLLFSDKVWLHRRRDWEDDILARFGGLIREREKFLLSLSIESRTSYLNYIAKFTENKE